MAGKRIYDLTEKSTLAADDFFAIDRSGQANAEKLNASKILTPLSNISGASDEYSASSAYNVGYLVIHDNMLYVCNTACSAAPWSTNSGYFTPVTQTGKINSLVSSYAQIKNSEVVALDDTTNQYGIITYHSPYLYTYKHAFILSNIGETQTDYTVSCSVAFPSGNDIYIRYRKSGVAIVNTHIEDTVLIIGS